MTQTPNYNLKKPAQNEFYNVDDFNDNFDTIDDELKKASETNVTIDSELSDISKNPVQNKVVKSALDSKSNTIHSHTAAEIAQNSTHRFVSDTDKANWNGKAEVSQSHQIGEVTMFAGTTAPTGYLLCQGQALSTTEYADLFAVIGYTYGGSGDSFNLPNLKGRVPVGIDSSQTEFDTLGETGGEKKHTLTVQEMPQHSHTYSGTSSAWGTIQAYSDGYRVISGGGCTTGATGGNLSHNNLQPYITLNYMIYTGV